ncbi:MAG TPA: hypothetical protein DDX14_07600, partial [Cyanobacteria bacterium UBA9579]|nr:hypothetical protein [Cyanobacteria bacterium UBA9579]
MKKLKTIGLILAFMLGLQSLQVKADEFDYDAINNNDRLSLRLDQSFTTRKYILGPNDIISISIYNVPEFDQKNIRVQPDGRLIITPLGSLKVTGLTLDELHDLLVQKYSHYLINPQVSINLDESRPFIVYITGAVANPGSYELNTSTNDYRYIQTTKPEISIERKTPLLSNMLVAAGGINHDADLERVQITNNIDGTKYEVNLLKLLEKGDSAQDIYLMAGDSVHVPQLSTPLAISSEKYKKYASATFSPRTVPVKVFGYVNNPGLIRLDPADSLNLNSAITAAGGYLSDSAYAPNKVYLSRLDSNGKLVTTVV